MISTENVLQGDRLALARILTQVENDTPDGRAALDSLFSHTGKAHLIGVTGAPGTGKSSLVNQLALHFRKQDKRVAIVAVDPSSPFTGGAVLGDRVRMKDLSGDTGVFIRSMATRGSLGGLAKATAGIVQVFDAAGYDIVMIETVGAGQSEVDIARLAHTTLVVEAPGLGDDIQAIKAGILEIADILVVNKADRPGVENTEKALKSMLDLAHPTQRVYTHHGKYMSTASPQPPSPSGRGAGGEVGWVPPILKTISTEGKGIAELAEQIEKHAAHLHVSGDWAAREHARLESELETALQETLMNQFRERVPDQQYNEVMRQVFERSLSPGEAVKKLTNGRAK
ncbi:MAG TPA: methylmalonyl Co-A mutase-associated GTPase MeaB [Anaerolineales bacterium]|nr:methylmalonyl Co-A mutase-associated GTPase MeaB [Anaerolineales bacterium]